MEPTNVTNQKISGGKAFICFLLSCLFILSTLSFSLSVICQGITSHAGLNLFASISNGGDPISIEALSETFISDFLESEYLNLQIDYSQFQIDEDISYKFFKNIITYSLSGDGEIFNSNQILKIIKSNDNAIVDKNGNKLTTDSYKEIQKSLKELNKTLDAEDVAGIISSTSSNFGIFGKFFSIRFLSISFLLALLAFIFIFLLLKQYPKKAFGYTTISSSISSILVLLCSVGIKLISFSMKSETVYDDSVEVFCQLLDMLFIRGLFCFFSLLLISIIFIFLKKKQ